MASAGDMASGNAELARAGYAAIARGDLETLDELLAPDVRWHGGDPTAEGACRNRDEAKAFIAAAIARAGVGRLVDVVAAGDRVVVIMQPPAADGLDPPLRANVTTFRDGKVIEIVAHPTPDAAKRAAGLVNR